MIRWCGGRLPCKIKANSGRRTFGRYISNPDYKVTEKAFFFIFFFMLCIFFYTFLKYSPLHLVSVGGFLMNDTRVRPASVPHDRVTGGGACFWQRGTFPHQKLFKSGKEWYCCPLIRRVTSLRPTKRGGLFILGRLGGGRDIHLGRKTSQASLWLERAALALLISGVVCLWRMVGGGSKDFVISNCHLTS